MQNQKIDEIENYILQNVFNLGKLELNNLKNNPVETLNSIFNSVKLISKKVYYNKYNNENYLMAKVIIQNLYNNFNKWLKTSSILTFFEAELAKDAFLRYKRNYFSFSVCEVSRKIKNNNLFKSK